MLMGCEVQGFRTSGERPGRQPSLNGAAMLGQASGLNSTRWGPGWSRAWLGCCMLWVGCAHRCRSQSLQPGPSTPVQGLCSLCWRLEL